LIRNNYQHHLYLYYLGCCWLHIVKVCGTDKNLIIFEFNSMFSRSFWTSHWRKCFLKYSTEKYWNCLYNASGFKIVRFPVPQRLGN